jgi:hypothetical protein
MPRLVLPVSLALAALAAGTLPAQDSAGNVTTVLPDRNPPPAAPSAPPARVIFDSTPANLPPVSHTVDGDPANGNCLACEQPEQGWGRFSAFGDVLLWRARWQNSDFAIIDPRMDLAPQGSVESANTPSRAGFRIGAGYTMPNSPWTATFTYTYFHSAGDDSLAVPAGGQLFPTLTRPGLIDTVTSAEAKSRINLNVYDIDIGRDFAVDPTFTLRVLGGVRLASLHEGLSAFYDGGDAVGAVVATGSSFSGAGPSVGGQGTWNLGNGFSLFGRARTSLLYGNVRSRITETNRNGAVLDADLTDNTQRAVPVVDLGVGVNWQYRWFSVAAGYEVSQWFQVMDQPQFVNDVAAAKFIARQSSLTLDGVYVRFGVTY